MTTHPYSRLQPELVLDAIESTGLRCDGRLLALNSFENRVFQVGLEDGEPLIAKFYRPQRWSDAALHEEHTFSRDLADAEIPAVPPLERNGQTLFEHAEFRFALFKRQGGRTPDFDVPGVLERIGRFLARLHAQGATRRFEARPALDCATFGVPARQFILDSQLLPPELQASYAQLSQEVLDAIDAAWQRAGNPALLRVHGDCHPGNLLWTDSGPHFVDLDDSCMAPAIQDLWMLLGGSREEMGERLGELLAGYEDFREFNLRELHLIEALRSLRILHHSAWLARRWDDPAFPAAFPWFNTHAYWQEQLTTLRDQLERMAQPALWHSAEY